MAYTEKAALEEVEIAYQVLNKQAKATPLVMIQGWTGVKEDWGELDDVLAQDRPVLVFDNRGMGASAVPEGPYVIEDMARDVVHLLDHLGWPDAHIMGISMGGMIAQQLAVDEPDRVAKLVLGCTGHGGLSQIMPEPEVIAAMQIQPKSEARETIRAFLWINYTEAWMKQNPERYEELVDEALAHRRPRRGMLNQMHAIMNFDFENKVPTITQPTLILHGESDRLIPFDNGKLLERKIPDARLIALPGAGHVFWQMDDGQSAKAVRDFLSS